MRQPNTVEYQNGRGLLLMALGFFCFASSDTLTKLLTDTAHPIQIVWARQAGLVAVVLILAMRRGFGFFKTAFPKLQITRGAFAVLAPLCNAGAFAFVPLAEAMAVTFVAPLIVTILGAFYLKEYVGPKLWIATALGFVGAIIVVRPGGGVLHPAIFLVFVAASLFAVRQVMGRVLATKDSTHVTLAYTAFVGFLVLCVPLPFFWKTPETGLTTLVFVAMALFAALGEVLIIRAVEISRTSVVAPMQYSTIIWATLFGWLIFAQFPDGWTGVGTAIIIATGIYIIRSESRSGSKT